MEQFNLYIAVVSLTMLVLSFFNLKTRRSVITEPIIAMAAGILLGPSVLNVLDVHESPVSFNKTIEITSMLAISIALMSGAFRLPKNYLVHNKKLQAKLLLAGMAGMCIISCLLMKLILHLNWMHALLIGAIITPTDPVISATIASGKLAHELIPPRVRNAITFESCANDGLAFPFVMLPLLFIESKTHPLKEWLLSSFIWETLAAIIIGAIIGFVAAKIFRKAKTSKSMAKSSMLIFSVVLGFFVLGFLETIGCNGIIGVFSAAFMAHTVLNKEESEAQSIEQEARERLFIVPVFFIFGLLIPWDSWFNMGWRAIAIAAAVLLLRRLPVVLSLKPWLKKSFNLRDVLFMGWFGPIGTAAMFYAVYVYAHVADFRIWVITSLIIFASTIVHGVSTYQFSKWYYHSNQRIHDMDKGNHV